MRGALVAVLQLQVVVELLFFLRRVSRGACSTFFAGYAVRFFVCVRFSCVYVHRSPGCACDCMRAPS